jgi:hypothetical protein
MDFQQAQDRREASSAEPSQRQAVTRKRADDARLRRAIREAFARQRTEGEPHPDPIPLHIVRPPQQP